MWIDWLLISLEVGVCFVCVCGPSGAWYTSCFALIALVIVLEGEAYTKQNVSDDSVSVGTVLEAVGPQENAFFGS